MSKKLTFLLLLLIASTPVLFAQVILPVDERASLLDDMKTVVSNTDAPSPSFAGVPSPFVENEVELAETDPQTPVQSDEPVRELPQNLSDSAALKLVSQQFKPLGSLVLGSRGILQLASGTTIEQGARFSAEIRGRSYEVTIQEVTQNGYTLRLGEAVLEQTFYEN